MSTALVFALLTNKGFAVEVEPLESDEVTSTALVPVGMDQMSTDTITHTFSFIDTPDLLGFALTSKDNYNFAVKLAEERFKSLPTELDLDCFEPSGSFFLNDTFKSYQIRSMLEEKIENIEGEDSLIYLTSPKIKTEVFFRNIIDFCEAHNYQIKPSLKEIQIEGDYITKICNIEFLQKNYPKLQNLTASMTAYAFAYVNTIKNNPSFDYKNMLNMLNLIKFTQSQNRDMSDRPILDYYLNKSSKLLEEVIQKQESGE